MKTFLEIKQKYNFVKLFKHLDLFFFEKKALRYESLLSAPRKQFSLKFFMALNRCHFG